jgi:hypothetical protein
MITSGEAPAAATNPSRSTSASIAPAIPSYCSSSRPDSRCHWHSSPSSPADSILPSPIGSRQVTGLPCPADDPGPAPGIAMPAK